MEQLEKFARKGMKAQKAVDRLIKRPSWVMPDWMEKYRLILSEPDRVEEFMNCDAKNCNIQVNAPRALICVSSRAEVKLLERLHLGGSLH